MKGVLFDFWGTLIENAIMPSPVRQVRYLMKIRTPFPEYIVRFEEVFMTKEYKDLYEAFEAVCKEFDIKPEKELLDNLVGMWNKNELLCKPFPETIKLLDELKGKYKIALITNTPSSVKRVIEKFELGKYFDTTILSYEVGMLKTNPKMFEKALKELKLKKDEVMMVGDSMETDVMGAEKAGIKAVLVDRRGRREYENKVSDLSEIKKFLEE